MSEQENLRVIQEAYDALNAHDLDRYTALLDDSYVWETGTLPAGPFVGREEARQAMEMYYRAFPKLHYDIEQNTASADYVVTRWRIHATHDGDVLGIAPTNREGEIHGCNFSTLKNGKIVHAWVYFCTGRVLHQMGMLAVPG